MRIHEVSMAGFGPFRHTQTVDLDAFADHGLFLITGRTGAGKSSILDAIVYALYDSAPRYASGGGRHVRSDHCTVGEPTRVELVFSSGDERYRVVRTPEYPRPKARGEGLTTERASAELSRWDGAQWVAIASQLRTVGEELHRIVPLSADQFLQVVLLAQGEFQRFLVASSEERQRLLRTLFASDRFGRYDELLQQRAGALRKRIDLADSGVDATIRALATHAGVEVPNSPDADWITAVLQNHDADVEAARVEAEQAQKELVATDQRLALSTVLLGRQGRLARARAALDALDEQQAVVEADRVRRDRGVAAASCAPAHRALAVAVAEQQAAADALDAAATGFASVVGVEPPADLGARRTELASRIATLRVHLADERRLERLRLHQSRLAAEATSMRGHLDELEAERATVAATLASSDAPSTEKAETNLAELRDELDRALRRERATADLAQAERSRLEFGRARTAASTMLDRLRERRLAEYAGTLAAQLHDGEPCAVCGSLEHPAPAAGAAEPVTEEMEQAAEQVLADADDRAKDSERVVTTLRARIDSLTGGRSAADLREVVAEAAETVRLARRAEAERTRAAARLERIDADLMTSRVHGATIEANLADTADRIVELDAQLATVRGEADSIADVLASLRAEKGVADDLATATARAEAAASVLAGARETLTELLRHHGFVDEAAFAAAQIDPVDLAELDREIRRHDEARATAAAVVADPELRDLPSDPPDVAADQAARDAAKAAADEAVGRLGSARSRADHANELATAIGDGWARTAAIRAEYEVLNRLARSLHGDAPNTRRMRLESYVLGAELTQIVTAANTRLRTMSSGRYELQRSTRDATKGNNAGLEVQVLDHHTGQTRSPESLSGGERFLASLSLALGLAEVVTSRAGGITLDTLFIDEGFGSLDAETLDIAMHTLDGLREHGRTVGLISHVEAMREQIPAQLAVETTSGGWSTVVSRH